MIDKNIKIIVLDDDPTGIQTVHGCLLLTKWDKRHLKLALSDKLPFFFILTNTRAYNKNIAEKTIRDIIKNILAVNRKVQKKLIIISRSDSTLRSHFPVEINTISNQLAKELNHEIDAVFLAPAFFESNRITTNDMHYLVENGKHIPTSKLEFARDSIFAYSTSHLPTYIEEKTACAVKKENVGSITLKLLRGSTKDELINLLLKLENNKYMVVNAQDYSDLDRFSSAILKCIVNGKIFLFQSAASFVKSISGNPDKPLLDHNILHGKGPGLIIAGSHVEKTTRQLEQLNKINSICPIEIDAIEILSNRNQTTKFVLNQIHNAIRNNQTPAIFTSRKELKFSTMNKRQKAGQEISTFLAKLCSEIKYNPAFIISKGGITSHVILTESLKVKQARVLGQILKGVPVIELPQNHKFRKIPFIIFPGNVGDDNALHDIYCKLSDQKKTK